MNDFTELVNLASERLGAVALAANDEFFAPKENLVRDAEPVWREGEYTDRGKWMDGWETRRRREPGLDWCLVRLAFPGIVRGVVVDTTHFRGNFPEACSFEAAELAADPPAGADLAALGFRQILPRHELSGDARNAFTVDDAPRATHLILRIEPDGGVARLRMHGDVTPDWERLALAPELDLAAVEHGGRVLAASDVFFGHRHHLVYPGAPRGMFDGWETRRRRGPGHDWAIVGLGAPGTIHRAVVDTRFFKGNAPGWCSLEGAATSSGEDSWREVLPRVPLAPDRENTFTTEMPPHEPVARVRLNIYPDGGVARLRLFGRPAW